MFRYGLTLRVDFGNLAGDRDSGIDRCFALLREFRLLAEEDHAECRAFHHAAWVGSENVCSIEIIGRKTM